MKWRWRLLAPLLIIVSWPSWLTAEEAPTVVPAAKKPAWEWTDEERFAVRYDPRHISERRARSEQRKAQYGRASRQAREVQAAQRQTDFVDGSDTPELFFPDELFGWLVTMRLAPIWQDPSGPIGRSIGRWREFGLQTSPEPLLRRETKRMLELYTAELPENDHSYCKETMAAFHRVREAMGAREFQAFLRLLYEATTPGLGVSSVADPGDGPLARDAATNRRWQMEGCP